MVTKEQAVTLLNEIHRLDPTVLQELVTHRVPCNEALANHPTVQVGLVDVQDGKFEVGILGIINGLFGVDDKGWGFIAANISNPPESQLTGFDILEPERWKPKMHELSQEHVEEMWRSGERSGKRESDDAK